MLSAAVPARSHVTACTREPIHRGNDAILHALRRRTEWVSGTGARRLGRNRAPALYGLVAFIALFAASIPVTPTRREHGFEGAPG
jgi:hypothetical protein